MLSQNEMEFESGEFEDLKANEMDDFSRGSESQNIHIYLFIHSFGFLYIS